MSHLRYAFALATVTLALAPTGLAQKAAPPELADLMKAGADYVAAYGPKVSGVTLDELWILNERAGTGAPGSPQRLQADLVLLSGNGRLFGLRDLYSANTKALREHQPRITKALAQPTPANWDLAQGYARENAEYLRANVVLWYSDPMLVFQFIVPSSQSRITYKLEGNKKMNGVQVFGLGFKEKTAAGTTYLLDTPGNPQASGRFWIDPATGAIHMTELWIQSDTDTARIQVNYAPDANLGILLPRESSGTFELREKGSNPAASNSQQKIAFDSNAKYLNPTYVPIDLNKVVR